MNKTTILLILILFMTCAVQSQDHKNYLLVPPESFLLITDSSMNEVIVDVRLKKHYKKKHLPKAINAPNKASLTALIENLDKENPVMVYCYNSTRSKTAAGFLIKNEFQKVYVLEGGFNAWKKLKYPVEK